MDTPKVPAPRDQGEREILSNLVGIRDELLLRKMDRTTYVRSQDVLGLYDRTVAEVKKLNEIRKEKPPAEENQVDRVVDSCFQLFSLFFMTIGRNNEVPVAYALTSTIIRLLDHLTEAERFTSKDLESLSHTLDRVTDIVQQGSAEPFVEDMIMSRIQRCRASLRNLRSKLDELDPTLRPVADELVQILRQMAVVATRKQFSPKELQKIKAQVQEIGAKRVDGQFLGEDGKPLEGSQKISEFLERMVIYIDDALERQGVIPDKWRPIYDVLIGIRNELDKLSLTQAWSLRETDLYDFQRQLDKIDEARVDGNWLDDQGRPAEPHVHKTLLYLIRRSYGYIYHLMITSEPVSEALLPVYNQLQTLKRCLIEVKKSGGVASVRELYPYSMKLNSIDNMRVDGKFMVGDDIPEGQGAVTELLSECFELNYELRVAVDSEQQSNKGES
ncbi:uncharacterized protein B0I36DRAFT_248149 [Microdochium trichocladiopsis]|uniref:Uncharacterized protein n=1 Tax=Microdochium trichocladiopsis TaxID=1682393 RepID=A0A9P8XZA8_9PEZI|nr:uncharacterized protein B0I36DRAFT_248149 [Microdochium trichocladiopsis]KAH7025924.1 hypothetical protein B0I36DRAFT_248149 [Microdochium trichocladiopsis]